MSLSLDALRAEVERLRAEVREAEERQAAGGSAARIDDDEEAAEDEETAAASPFLLEPQWLATNRIVYSNGDVYEASRSASRAHDARHHAPHAWRLQDSSRFRVHLLPALVLPYDPVITP